MNVWKREDRQAIIAAVILAVATLPAHTRAIVYPATVVWTASIVQSRTNVEAVNMRAISMRSASIRRAVTIVTVCQATKGMGSTVNVSTSILLLCNLH